MIENDIIKQLLEKAEKNRKKHPVRYFFIDLRFEILTRVNGLRYKKDLLRELFWIAVMILFLFIYFITG